ncbi:MAG: hypothetical protein U0N52_03040 [Muribaculaceae bacterium]|nr:hypothetical protein [Prevotella sp.]
MKKLLLFTLTALMGTTAGNAAVTLACWDSSTGASKQGSSALVAYATEKGISTTGDNKQIQFTEIEDGNYVLTFTRDVVMSNGDRFCIHDTDNGDKWIHFHDSTFPAYNRQWLTVSSTSNSASPSSAIR